MLVPIVIFVAVVVVVLAVTAAGGAKGGNKLRARLGEDGDTPRAAEKGGGDGLFASLDVAMRRLSFAAKLRKALKRADMPMKVSEFMVFVLLSAVFFPLLGVLITGKSGCVPVLAAVGGALPFAYLKRRHAARNRVFAAQLLDAITLISNSLKSGYSFAQSMELVTHELPPPISDEFRKTLRETQLGLPLERALQGLIDRVANEDLDLVLTSVMIQRQVGGNLSEVLDKIAHTIRERIRIKGQVRTLSAQGRLSGLILGLLPAGLGVILYAMTPDYIGTLFRNPLGRSMLVGAVVMQCFGLLLIRKIVDIKV